MNTRISLFALIAVVACACTNVTSYETKIKELRDSVSVLSAEIEMYKNLPNKLAADIDQLFKNKDEQALRSIYDKLSIYHPEAVETAKVKVYLDKILAEREAKILAEKEAKRQAVKNLKKKYDDVSNITWYYNRYFTHYNNTNYTSLYMGQRGTNGTPWLRLMMSYTGDDWIFFEHAYLSYEGNTIEIPFNQYQEKKSDNSGGAVWEWIDVEVSNNMLSFMREMVNGNNVKMRLSGKYTKTRNLSTNEIKAIQDLILGYDFLSDSTNR
ncbi:MAG: hypothetical protein MJZ64_08110 [Paludibacteraceae bacterium]|nr:hypothetical protein [Paludibacteraceae bacterium]